MEPIDTVSGMILAGGLSTRIGKDKGGLEIGGQNQWERSAENMLSLFSEVIYVTNDHSFVSPYEDLVIAHDEIPHQGPLGGILAGMMAATCGAVFVVAYDMPFVVGKLVRFLCGLKHEGDIVVPVVAGEYEPLHAVYSCRCAPRIRSQLELGKRKIIEIFDHLSVREVDEAELKKIDPELRTFFNINTWEDVRQADSMLRGDPE